MNVTMMNARTVAVTKELTTEMRHGANGDFESKSIFFRIAVDRNHRLARTVNGQTTMEYPTDFYLAKATGAVAENLAKYCTAKKADGKLVSRHLLLKGSFETYQKDVVEPVELQVNINGTLYNVKGETTLKNRTQYVFVIDEFTFLDKNPTPNNGGNVATAAPAMATAAPAAYASQPQQAAPVMAQAPVTQMPQGQVPMAQPSASVMAQAPVAAQPVMAQAQAPVAPQAPTVDQNFVAAGGTAPF